MHTDAAVDLRKLGTKEVSTFHQRALNQNLLTAVSYTHLTLPTSDGV